MITQLTPTQLAELPKIRDEWIRNGLEKRPINRTLVSNIIGDLYAVVGKSKPKFIVFLRSPIEIAYAIESLLLHAQVSDQVRDQVRDQVYSWRWWYGFGQFEAGWISYFKSMQMIGIDCSRIIPQMDLCKEAGFCVLFWEWAFICERPEIFSDESNRLHCENGPAVLYPDGFSVYAIHGVRVPAWIIEQPNNITVAKIENESNAEIRRVMVEKYGQERYLIDSKAAIVHEDDFGKLYRKEQLGDEPLMMVMVVNSTAEPDGSFKNYFLRVHPELRPLPPRPMTEEEARNWFLKQQPQKFTAHNAVASTFSLRGEEYAPEVET